MQRIIHRRYGRPSEVLEVANVPSPILAAGNVLVRITYAPIHPGDLLGIAGSPAFGPAPALYESFRSPGFEGAGVIEEIASDVAPGEGWKVGDRVAFFPAVAAWSEWVAVPTSSLVRIPDDVPDEVAAQMLINVVTARLIHRAGYNALPIQERTGATVIQTGAASAVGRLLTTLLSEVGMSTIRLVRSQASAAALRAKSDDGPVIATEDAHWQEHMADTVGSQEIHVALDGVGGGVLPVISDFIRPGGTIINYGSLGGETTDIRSLVPRHLTLRGLSVMQWGAELPGQREEDIKAAVRLAQTNPGEFRVAARFVSSDIVSAVDRVEQPGRFGTVLLTF